MFLGACAFCNKLFEYERSYKAKGLSYTQVHKRRLKDEKPIVEGFIRWLDAQRPEKGSRMDRAVTYIRNRKDRLMTYLEDGRCSLSNNPSLYTGYFYPHLFRKCA